MCNFISRKYKDKGLEYVLTDTDLKSELAIGNYLTVNLVNATVAYSFVQSVMALQARMSPWVVDTSGCQRKASSAISEDRDSGSRMATVLNLNAFPSSHCRFAR